MSIGLSRPHSYRGDYAQVAFVPVRGATVAESLAAAASALDQTYTGWKGGEFKMHSFVNCYLAQQGETGDAISQMLIDLLCGREPSIGEDDAAD